MSTEKKKRAATEPDALGDATSQHLPPVEGDQHNEPGRAGSPHLGQGGHGGSGMDADVQSIGKSQSDRAAGKSS